MLIAALDFGSNSLKCLFAEITPEGISYGQDIRLITRLGSALDEQGNISTQAIQNSVAAVNTIIKDLPLQTKVIAVGTEALRKAANNAEFVRAIWKECGIELKIISADEESKLAWLGVLSGLPDKNEDILLFDSGGASTEIIHGMNGKILQSVSLPIGAVNLHGRFVHSDPISNYDLQQLSHAISHSLNIPFFTSAKLFATGGGVLACAKVALQNDKLTSVDLDGFQLTMVQLKAEIEMYKTLNITERKQIPGMEAERADIILCSAMLYHAIMQACSVEVLTVSSRGVRHGLLHQCKPGVDFTFDY
ncbi:MAG: exopolyphosphatase [Candidatus Cloacimonetes bacterium]|nr:exopolyphosphatase [Candidatus Cloacimonadota bacterium]